MTSSYSNKLTFGELIKTLVFLINPKKIVEFGILDGYSLTHFIHQSKSSCQIEAFDIFDDFNGNHANFNQIMTKFSKFPNVNIQKGDFYKMVHLVPNKSIDILHVDIANNGDTYEFVFKDYLKKMRKGGIILLEGGSNERDEVYWMKKYNKRSICEVLEHYNEKLNIHTIQSFPSMTIIHC